MPFTERISSCYGGSTTERDKDWVLSCRPYWTGEEPGPQTVAQRPNQGKQTVAYSQNQGKQTVAQRPNQDTQIVAQRKNQDTQTVA